MSYILKVYWVDKSAPSRFLGKDEMGRHCVRTDNAVVFQSYHEAWVAAEVVGEREHVSFVFNDA